MYEVCLVNKDEFKRMVLTLIQMKLSSDEMREFVPRFMSIACRNAL